LSVDANLGVVYQCLFLGAVFQRLAGSLMLLFATDMRKQSSTGLSYSNSQAAAIIFVPFIFLNVKNKVLTFKECIF